jgi:hypothetical protein
VRADGRVELETIRGANPGDDAAAHRDAEAVAFGAVISDSGEATL